jgi:putative ABC transport system permease protein
VKPFNILLLYRLRLRVRRVQEALAVFGIAAGVALLFASQVSSTSLQNSVGQLSRGIAGRATLQLRARSPLGFPQDLLAQVRGIPGVRVAAPVVEANGVVAGPRAEQSAALIGADPSLPELGGTLARSAELAPFGGFGAVVLSSSLAHATGAHRFGEEVLFRIGGRTVEAPLYTEAHERQSPTLAASPVMIAPLSFAQRLADMQGRLSRILVQPARGHEAQVRTALRSLARGHLDVKGIDYDEQLFAMASSASNQSTALFSLISALVGFMFAFNAMLFAVPDRRRLVTEMRSEGFRSRTVLAMLLVDASTLGLAGCVLGLGLGEELSIHVLHSNPAFLSLAFTLGSQRVVDWQSVALATGGGLLATFVAVLGPLLPTLGHRVVIDAPDSLTARRRPSKPLRAAGLVARMSAIVGLACLVATTLILAAWPDAATPAVVLSVSALLLLLPPALSTALGAMQRVARMRVGPIPHLAAMELRSTRMRAVSVAATGALAVFGSVAIQGAHRDLLSGLDQAAHDMNRYADIWVAPVGDYNLLHTTPFSPLGAQSLAQVQGVRAVLAYRGGLLDYGRRRTLVIAPPANAAPSPLGAQIVEGDTAQTIRRLRAGGWLVLSRTIASERGLRIGQTLRLPTPEPRTFRVAALSSNMGWAPGVIVMNARDYERAWGSAAVSAYDILLRPGASGAQAVKRIQSALRRSASTSGLRAQLSASHVRKQSALSHRALARLGQIATLILLVSVLAMVAAIGAMIWRRRPRLAKLKLEGLSRIQLWRTMLFESVLLLGTGCGLGAVFGLYAHALADRALAQTIGFPVSYSFAASTALASLGLVLVAALAILAIPGYLAASVPAALAASD